MKKQDKKYLMEVINKLLTEASLGSFYKKQYSKKMDADTYMSICNADPTTNGDTMGKYCIWLLREFSSGKYSINYDNLKNINNMLSFYDKYKGRIKSRYPEYADITNHDLYDMMDFVENIRESFEMDDMNKNKSSDAECVYNDKEW